MAYKTGNPALRSDIFSITSVPHGMPTEALKGFKQKIIVSLTLYILSGAISWYAATRGNGIDSAGWILITAILSATVVAWILILKKHWAPLLSPIFTLLLGTIAGIFWYGMISAFGHTASGWALIAVIVSILCFGAVVNVRTDMEMIRQGYGEKPPRLSDWYASFSLQVSVCWFILSIGNMFMRGSGRGQGL